MIPKKPVPTECRLECSCCGYTAPKSEFNKNHKYCLFGRLILGFVLLLPSTVLIYTVYIMYMLFTLNK